MNEEERQSEHDDPGEQAQGQAEGETPPTAGAGDRLSVRSAFCGFSRRVEGFCLGAQAVRILRAPAARKQERTPSNGTGVR